MTGLGVVHCYTRARRKSKSEQKDEVMGREGRAKALARLLFLSSQKLPARLKRVSSHN